MLFLVPGEGIMNDKSCRNCHRSNASRSRGLCYHCYQDREIRHQFSPVSPYGIHFDDLEGPRPAPKRKTKFFPGSKEKIELLRTRAERLESLWHEEDGRRDLR